MTRVKEALFRKLGPLPAWGWLLGAGIGLYLWRNKGLSLGGGSITGGSVTTAPQAELAGTSTALTPSVGAGAGDGSGLDTTSQGLVPGGGPSPTIFDPATGQQATGFANPGPIDTSGYYPGDQLPYNPGGLEQGGGPPPATSGAGDTPQRGHRAVGGNKKHPPVTTTGQKSSRVRGKHTRRAPELVSENGKGQSRPGRGMQAQPASRPHGASAQRAVSRTRTVAAAKTGPRVQKAHTAPVRQPARAAYVKTQTRSRPRR